MLSNAQKEARTFLEKHGMLADAPMERELKRYLAEMEDVLNGSIASLKMIPTYTGKYQPSGKPEKAIVLDLGGTNCRTALVTFMQGREAVIEKYRSFPAPGIEREISPELYFDQIAAGLEEIAGESSCIGFCFSHASIPQKNGDAVFSAASKQLKVPELMGQPLGKCLRAALQRRGWKDDHRITVINDSVAVALAGSAENSSHSADGYLGFIYGTGTNTCYTEQLPDGEAVINVESGAYALFPRGDLDDRFNSTLPEKETDRFEKMVSGGYQGGLMKTVLTAGCEEGLFTHRSAENFAALHTVSAKDISAFSAGQKGSALLSACAEASDAEKLLYICNELTDRSARLSCITLTAALIKGKAGLSADAFITAEGSTFSLQKGFRETLEQYMHQFTWEKYGIRSSFHVLENAVLKGTAAAGLAQRNIL